MKIDWKGSPNRHLRRSAIKKIVIHWFGVGTLESANNRFQNAKNQVSAHFGISKGRVWQWVKETDVAYHAGNAQMNEQSIGIEHDALVSGQALSEQDYQHSAELVRTLCKRYNLPINSQTVIGHRNVKATQCPGTIDINKIINLAKGNNMAQIKSQAKGASRRIIIEAENENEWNVLAKVYGKDPKTTDEKVKDE